jgi:class 3 adenylate cyclase
MYSLSARMPSELREIGLNEDDLRINAPLTEDAVEQMLVLAERLREANGGNLDDDAIQAVAEATGAPIDYVRLAVKVRADRDKKLGVHHLRAQFLTLEPETRRLVGVGLLASLSAILFAVEYRLGPVVSQYGVMTMAALLAISFGAYQTSLSKDAKWAATNAAILGGGTFGMFAIVSMLLQSSVRIFAGALIPILFGSAIVGMILQRFVASRRDVFGLKDPVRERQQLLAQLVELQDKLKSGEKSVTFLSVDIVGSTKMKANADSLAVEYTFGEYQGYVQRITERFGGRVHSTAGDGVTAAFDHPHQAFMAAKAIQTGLFELNTFRNRLGAPIRVRCGVHTGAVVMPDGADITSVNFSHVIDVAATVQKYAPAGGVAVTEASATYLPGGLSAIGSETVEAADCIAAIWLPKTVVVEAPKETTPPLPAV